MALPWMESLPVFGGEAGTSGSASGAPRRLGVFFMGNGVNPHHWGGENAEGGLRLNDTLRPLESFKDELLIFKGLWNPTTVTGPGGHYPKMNLLSGLKVKQTTTDVEVGVTMDQMLAKEAHSGSEHGPWYGAAGVQHGQRIHPNLFSVHLVEFANDACSQRDLSAAGV